jgi:pantoate--beta-alanine ligase
MLNGWSNAEPIASMHLIHDIPRLRERVAKWRRNERRIGLVPTMGNLHDGHLALVRQAMQLADRVVVSLFVNPLQFAPSEDFDRYPRTLEQDRAALEAIGAHCLFAPAEQQVYPNGRDQQTRVEVPHLSDLLCGATRPGFFQGVATVVTKLFNMVQPDLAVFGEKDYQQLLVIRRLVADLDIPVEIVSAPIVREPDGLAMSSRNAYLTPMERETAPALQRVLQRVAAALQSGDRIADAEWDAARELTAVGFRPDYISVRRADDLAPAGTDDRELVILAAAFLGKARLIDNLRLSLGTA